MIRLACAALLLLSACGADGPPTAPERADPPPGLSISGEGRVGVIAEL